MTMKTETTSTDNYVPISPVPKPQATDAELEERTNIIGDDPKQSKEVLAKQAEDDRLKAEELQRKQIAESINKNMEKQRTAMADTMFEVMHGYPRPKDKDGER